MKICSLIIIACLLGQTEGNFGSPCEINQQCRLTDGLTCIDKTCQCSSPQIWLDTTCGNKRIYQEDCKDDTWCDTSRGLSCDPQAKTCNCLNVHHYWNDSFCGDYPKYKEMCSATSLCDPQQGLTCVQGVCLCPSDKYWIGNQCARRKDYLGECSSHAECREGRGLICLADRCTCHVFKYYEPNVGCLDGLLVNSTASTLGADSGCRGDLGLAERQDLHVCSCYPGRWSSAEGICVENKRCLEHPSATNTANNCFDYLKAGTKDVFLEQDMFQQVLSATDSAMYVCQSHAKDAIECIDSVLKHCPESMPLLDQSRSDGLPPLYQVYNDYKSWSDENCETSKFADFESSSQCVQLALVSDSFKTCFRALPKVDTTDRNYACGITDDAKSCFQASVGTKCNEAAAEIAFSIVDKFILKQEGCPTLAADFCKPCYYVLLLLLSLSITVNIRI